MTISYKEAIEESIKYFNGDELAANIFVTKYALTDKAGIIHESSPDQMHRRLASEFARIELKYMNPLTEDEIYELFKDFKFGFFKVNQSIAQVQDILNKISEYKQFNEKVYRHKVFVLAYMDCLTHPDFDHDKMVHKVSVIPDKFEKCETKRDYILSLEDIYNYRNQNSIKLY